MKHLDEITADNLLDSKGAIKALGFLPSDFEQKTKEEKKVFIKNQLRKLKFLSEKKGLKRHKITGKGYVYFKSQCERFLKNSFEGDLKLSA